MADAEVAEQRVEQDREARRARRARRRRSGGGAAGRRRASRRRASPRPARCASRGAPARSRTRRVAIMPTARPTMIVRGSSWMLVLPSSRPTRRSSARSAGRDQEPDEDADDRRYRGRSTSDSAITERSTCRREAPSVRSSANSRVRWATVTVKVLKMRKPPTSSATPANTSSAVRMKPSASDRSCACFSACSLPVRTAKSRRRARARSPP